MENPFIIQRMDGMLHSLRAAHAGSKSMSSASKGAGRSDFIKNFLAEAIPPAYRIKSSADITDSHGTKSGEVDIVLENGFAPSFPMIGSDTARLHLAEGVGLAIEVKSDLCNQWDQALQTAARIKSLRREITGGTFGDHGMTTIFQASKASTNPNARRFYDPIHDALKHKIAVFLVGYEGWSGIDIIKQKLNDHPGIIDGILQIDRGFFVSSKPFNELVATGPLSLYALLICITRAFTYIKDASFDLLAYTRD